jgi:glycosyltransferase involved in cell wall biosynthesis
VGHSRLEAAITLGLSRAQRRGWRVPGLVRSPARVMLQRAAQHSSSLDNWTTPLVGTSWLGDPPAEGEDSAAGSRVGELRVRSERNLNCIVATGSLDVGGSAEVVAFLSRRLPDCGIDTTVLYTDSTIDGGGDGRGRVASTLRRDGVPVAEVTESSAASLLAKHRPDVISAHGAPVWWLELAARHRIPVVETLHGMHSLFDADWAYEAVRSTQISRLIAVSELVRQQYLAGNPTLDEHRIVTVPNSVEQERMLPISRERARAWLNVGDDFLFVSLSRYSLQKNNYGLVSAFADVAARHREARLLVAGRPDDASYSYQVLKLRAGLPCRNRIHLRDHAPSPAALLAAADGFVLDSFFEGWALASMEALYAGVPVVLSDVGGAREQIGTDGHRGYLVRNPVGDPLEVDWQSIRRVLYGDQPNRDELIEAMSRMIEERENWRSRRSELQSESAIRFHADGASGGHADVLRMAASEVAT